MKSIKKFETTMWMLIKAVFYFLLMVSLLVMLAQENPTVLILSRTMGTTVFTFCIVGLLLLSVYGKYDVGRRKSKPIIYSMALAVLFTDMITYLQLMIMNTVSSVSAFRLRSLEWLALAYLLQLVVIFIFVYGGNFLFFRLHDPERCCIITSSQESLNSIANAILKYKKQYKIVYIADYRNPNALVDMPRVDTMFIHDIPVVYRSELVRYCYEKKLNIYFNPEIEDIVEVNSAYYLLDDVSILNKNVKEWTMEQRIAKKAMDMTLAILAFIISSPIWLISAIAIKLYDGGPVFFKQRRATINGWTFDVYKFRTMKEDVENRSVTEGDDRITKPGKILRKTRMDELPQLINILKGEMSFVGPRPEMLENVVAYEEELPEFKYRLRVKAGLTGFAQVSGKYNTSPKDKLIMDMLYMESFSILKDIQILMKSFIVFFKSDSTEAFRKGGHDQYVFEAYEEGNDAKK